MADRARRREAASAADVPAGAAPESRAAPVSEADGLDIARPPATAPTLEPSPTRPKRRSGGVAVVAGGLLQDLEERLRRDLAPVELRVRPGEELRVLAGGTGDTPEDPLVIVLPPSDSGSG